MVSLPIAPAAGFADLSRFFAPRSVALVGATHDLAKFGGRCMRLLIDFGFTGEIYPVNPKRREIYGRRCYASVGDLPEAPDHVGIVLPAESVPAAVEACAERGVPFVTVFSSGFGETATEAGRALERRIVAIGRAGGVRFMGPNCNGLVNFVDGFALTSTATIKGTRRPPGDIGIATQSGGAGQVNVMWRAQQAGLDISYQVSCGNSADLDLLDYMAFMVEDERTRVILAIAERLTDGQKLRALARRAAELGKPLVMIKIGRTDVGSRAAASHTGAVTGADEVFDAALRQMGILRVDDCNELYELAMLLRRGRIPQGPRLAATSVSGGNLVMLADLGASLGLEWPGYAGDTEHRLRALLPDFSATANPTDLTSAAIGRQGAFAAAAGIIAEDAAVDAVVPVLTMSSADEIRSVAEFSAASAKPVAILWTGGTIDDPALTSATLVGQGHAVYRDALPCLKALHAATRYGEARARLARAAPARPAGIDVAAARRLVAGSSGALTEHRSKALLACYGLPVPRGAMATSPEDAVRRARELGTPAALKIQSPDIPHKTEAEAIRLGIVGDEAIRSAYREVVAAARRYRPDARIEGVLLEETIENAHEVLVGIARDPTFGPVLAVGMGGIYVEVLRDVAFRLPPVDREAAGAMLRELRMYPLLAGARGRPAADVEALVLCIERVSWLAVDLADVVAEVDLNPLCVLPPAQGVRVVDALIVAGGTR